MRGVVRYKITCSVCKRSDIIGLVDERNILWDKNTNIVSGRKRLDGNWGFQCLCGNNNLLTVQENENISDLQSPDPKEIQDVIDDLVVQNDNAFKMEAV